MNINNNIQNQKRQNAEFNASQEFDGMKMTRLEGGMNSDLKMLS
jgi:hypothetical protein